METNTGVEKKKEEPVPETHPRASQKTDTSLRPILIDLGSRSKKAIKELKRGEGDLLDEALDALEDIRQSLGPEYKEQLLPVLIIYRQKQKTDLGSFPFISPFSLLGK
jgi:hypothetical protein